MLTLWRRSSIRDRLHHGYTPRYITTRCKAKSTDRPSCRSLPTLHGPSASRRSGAELDRRRASVWRRRVLRLSFCLRRRARFDRSAVTLLHRRCPLAVSSHNVSRYPWRRLLTVFSELNNQLDCQISPVGRSPSLVVCMYTNTSL